MKCPRTILAIDVGSSRAKAALVDPSGSFVRAGAAEYAEAKKSCPASERAPDAWWEGATAAVQSLSLQPRSDGVEAVVACGATLVMVLLDGKGRPICPAILWDDPRGQEEAEELRRPITSRAYSAATGASFPVSCVWPVPRMLWLARHEPECLRSLQHVLQPKDYVNYKLTGRLASDPDSQRGLANLLTRRFEWDALAELGISRRWETPLVEPRDIMGRVQREAASSWGIREGTPVLAGTHDFTAAVLGLGRLQEGECGHVTGTSDHLGRMVPMPDGGMPDSFPLSLVPFTPSAALLYGVISSGGGALDWACRLLGASPTGLEGMIPAEPASRLRAPLFAPYLQGERTPLWDPQARASFVGLRSPHGAGDLLYAVLEGVAFALRAVMELMDRSTGKAATCVRIGGGAARHRFWNEIKAEAWSRPVRPAREPEAGLMGGAILASSGLGWHSSIEEAQERMVRLGDALLPAKPGSLDARFEAFQSIHPVTKGLTS